MTPNVLKIVGAVVVLLGLIMFFWDFGTFAALSVLIAGALFLVVGFLQGRE